MIDLIQFKLCKKLVNNVRLGSQSLLRLERSEEKVEFDGRKVHAARKDETRGDVDTPESSQVLMQEVRNARRNHVGSTHRLGQPLQQLVQTDLVDQRLGERTSQH